MIKIIPGYYVLHNLIAKKTQFYFSHDRFLIIDDDSYHFGASLKDPGKKWFAFSKLNIDFSMILTELKK